MTSKKQKHIRIEGVEYFILGTLSHLSLTFEVVKLLLFLLLAAQTLRYCSGQPAEVENTISVAFYNVENLFDTIDDPKTYDEQYTPSGDRNWNQEKYLTKLNNLASVISTITENRAPAFLGLCEVENKVVLHDLINQPKLKDANYGIVHYDSPDERGIDVAFLYHKDVFSVLESKVIPIDLSDFNDKTRDILLVKGELVNKEILYFFINHWPSRGGGQKQSESKRIKAAKTLRASTTLILEQNKNAKIIVMGDFNDEPSNNSINKHLNIGCTASTCTPYQLHNVFCELENKGQGSYRYRGKWNMLDQIMISHNLIYGPGVHYQANSASIKTDNWMRQQGGKFDGYPLRSFGGKKYLAGYSDHLPIFIQLLVE